MNALNVFFSRLKWRIIWSWTGIRDCWVNEHSFRSWVWANLVSGAFALWLPLSFSERALILALGVLVLASEALNTAVENTIDYISSEQHEMARRAKDAASAGVFLTAIAAGVAWVVVLARLWLGG